MKTKFYFFEREATEELESGWTISKKPKLPEGDFRINEYKWCSLSLFFVDKDNFSADERQAAYIAFVEEIVGEIFMENQK